MTGTGNASAPEQIDFKDGASVALIAAWILAVSATLTILFIGEIMGQQPCLLCWYQRIAMLPLSLILAVAVWRNDLSVWRFALPLAVAGLLLAAFHTLVYFGVVPETLSPCGAGPSCVDAAMTIFGLPIPVLSLAAFIGLCDLLLRVRKGERK